MLDHFGQYWTILDQVYAILDVFGLFEPFLNILLNLGPFQLRLGNFDHLRPNYTILDHLELF